MTTAQEREIVFPEVTDAIIAEFEDRIDMIHKHAADMWAKE